jgi:hypothetical protein
MLSSGRQHFPIHRDQEDHFFAWPSVALLCIKTRSAVATGHFPVPPLQQVEVSIRTSGSFNQKLRKSRLELTEINFAIEINQSCDEYHIPCQAFCKGFLVLEAAIWESHEMVAGPHSQIKSTIYLPLHYAHYAGMASCISWHY